MSITINGKNTMLGALAIDKASLHSAFPGSAGANEISGGSYARQSATFGAASGASRTMSAALNFPVPACTVQWVAFRDVGGTVLFYSPNGGNPREYYVDVASSTFYVAGHGYIADQQVTVYGDTMPGGITEGTVYYVRNPATNTFQLAATAGGTPITLSSTGGSAALVSQVFSDVYAGAGTHTINTCTVGLPN